MLCFSICALSVCFLIHIIFRAEIYFLISGTLKPPLFTLFTAVLRLILSCLLFQINLKPIFRRLFTKSSGGSGSRIQGRTSLVGIRDFKIATLPSGVISLFDQMLNNAFTSKNFSLFFNIFFFAIFQVASNILN